MARVMRKTLRIPQGATYRHTFVYLDRDTELPIDLTGYTARCHFRQYVDDVSPFFEGTTENGKMTINAADGEVVLDIDPTDSDAWTVYDGVYNIEIIAPNSDVTRLVQGKVKVDRDATY